MDFIEIFREERYYCAHLFRLLCHDKETGGEKSGLAGFLKLVGANVSFDSSAIDRAEIYSEVAVFRDFYHEHPDPAGFLTALYIELLRIISPANIGGGGAPIPPDASYFKGLHPRSFAGAIKRLPGYSEQDLRFYEEFSALFSAKPDLLIICGQRMLWFEVKFLMQFDSNQLRRTKNIAALCSSPVFEPLFGRMPNRLFILGTRRPRSGYTDVSFVKWIHVVELAERVLPGGPANYSARALRALLEIDATERSASDLDE